MPQLVIHPGYPKAASSWLQDHVWDNQSLGFRAPWAVPGLWGSPADVTARFIDVEDDDFDPRTVRDGMAEGLAEARRADLIPVLSAELLIDHADGLGGWTEPVARRLHATFPDARIVIVVREQRDALASAYRHFVSVGGAVRVTDFLRGGGIRLAARIQNLRYDRVVGLYDELFGRDAVTVVPFELLRLDPHAFVGSIIEAGGSSGTPADLTIDRQPSNRGWSAIRLAVQRRLNHRVQPNIGPDQPAPWMYSVRLSKRIEQRTPDRLVAHAERRLRRAVEAEVADAFAPHNRRLEERTGFDLAGLGYAT